MLLNDVLEISSVTDQRFLRSVVNSLPMPVIWKDKDSFYLGCNQHFLDYEGFGSEADIIGKTDYQMPWKQHARQYRDSDRQVLNSQKALCHYEEYQIRTDGNIRWYKTSKIPLLGENSESIGILVLYEDVTEKKHAESELIHSEKRYRNMIETTGTGYVCLNSDGIVSDVNSHFISLAGLSSRTEIIGHSIDEFISSDHSVAYKLLDYLSLQDQVDGLEVELLQPCGKVVPLEINSAKNESENGLIYMVLCRDLTIRDEARLDLSQKDQFLKNVLNDLKTYLAILKPDGKIVYINEKPLKINDILLTDIQDTFFYDCPWWGSQVDRNLIKHDLGRSAFGETVSRKMQVNMGTRGLRWISVDTHPIVDESGEICRIIVEGRDVEDDVSEIKVAQNNLYEEKKRLQVTLRSIGDAVVTTDTKGVIDYINPVAESLTGWNLHEALGKPLTAIVSIVNEDDRKPCNDPITLCVDKKRLVSLGNQSLLINRTGIEFSIQSTAAPIVDDDGVISGVVLAFTDITESRRLTRQLAFHATHDALTELVNRRAFHSRLRQVIQASKENDDQTILGFLDLDQFKIINDRCGHVAGDEFLRQLASLIKKRLGHRETLARIGGDEFAILIEDCTLTQALSQLEGIRQTINTFRFKWLNQIFTISVSIGVVVIKDPNKSSSELLSDADAACYLAKQRGRDRIHVYQDDDQQLTRQRSDMQWFSQITQALESDRFCLYYQPIYSLNKKRGVRYELLVRMKGNQEQLIFPTSFLPAAEHYAIATKIDRWVFKEAFNWLQSLPQHLEELDHCAINLSGHSLSDNDFLLFLLQLFEDTDLPPEKICIEVTETAAISNMSNAKYFMNTLQKQGCSFALDDFGMGLSSFSYLKNLSVDYLKIDGSFVKNIVNDPDDFAIVKSINDVGHTMGKQTIAEFAENRETLDCLNEIGVDYVQGYIINRPRSISEIGLTAMNGQVY
ncbi:MAG: EAL domain-containing protein [Gammaproteobacteria bacterium]|nr:EAL domain-containing protein [Gammaproteobacteria bacterium]